MWNQQRGTFTNFNIFSSLLQLETMTMRTLGGDSCDSPGDYLR